MSRNHSTDLEPLVSVFEHLSDKARGAEALERLRKIASIVKPLMRQRNWVVGTLAEFYPAEHNLLGLNINRGQKICLRLRYAGDDHQFLPLESVVDTMLHELAHNVIGPHNREFHALWDKLRDEHEALVRKGYTGEGFLGRGNRLGGRRMPVSEVKRQARAAAERRRVLSAGSGQKLGGSGIMRGQDARAVIAAAAEKRIKIERGCASNTDRGRQIARDEAAKKDRVMRTTVDHEDEQEAAIMQAYIELIQEDEKAQLGDLYLAPTLYSHSPPLGSSSHNSSNNKRGKTNSSNNQTSSSSGLLHTRQNALDSIRKFDEQEAYKRNLPVGWQCHGCGNWMETQWWTCSVCGQMKASS
ncbi:hypothetical protein DV735_g5176, partial [Chaetothyriales sp. CBS 134920]